jgi:hypothetical protein
MREETRQLVAKYAQLRKHYERAVAIGKLTIGVTPESVKDLVDERARILRRAAPLVEACRAERIRLLNAGLPASECAFIEEQRRLIQDLALPLQSQTKIHQKLITQVMQGLRAQLDAGNRQRQAATAYLRAPSSRTMVA